MMDLTEILSISGKPGLYKMISHTNNGMLVESFNDQKRFPVFAHEKISSLEEISIFSETEDVPLKEVFKKIFDLMEGDKALSHKSSTDELKDFFDDAIPDYDKERVYVSDIKKVIQWYNILHELELLEFSEEEEGEMTEERRTKNEERTKDDEENNKE